MIVKGALCLSKRARSSRTKCVSDHTWHVLQPPSSLTPGPCHCLGCSNRVCKAHVVQNGRCATVIKVCMLTIFKRYILVSVGLTNSWANTRSNVISLPTLTSILFQSEDVFKFVCIDFSSQHQKRRKALCIQTDLFLSCPKSKGSCPNTGIV